MIRIRPGASWKQDPELRRELARSPAEAVEHLVDALAIEVDGIDLAAGRAEAELVPTLEALVVAVSRLVEGTGRADVHFAEGGVELLLRRRGAAALITVVALERPSRVLARDVEVDLGALAEAAREAGAQLVADLEAAAPGRELSSRLGAAVARLSSARTRAPEESAPAPPTPVRSRRRGRRDAPTCGFELHDPDGLLASYRGPGADLGSLLAPGRVFARTGHGDEIFSVAGAPFLALRDLAAFAARIVAAIAAGSGAADPVLTQDLALPGRGRWLRLAVDLSQGTLAAGERPARAVAPLLLARAFLEAAVDFCGVAAARNPWQRDNPWIAELRASAAERLALAGELAAGDQLSAQPVAARAVRRAGLPRAPLGAGRIRRVAFRRTWRVDVGTPAAGLFPVGDAVVVAGGAAVASLDLATGADRWRAPGAEWAALAAGRMLTVSGGTLDCRDAASGSLRWSRALDPGPGLPRAAFVLHDGPLVLGLPRALLALDPGTGDTVWTFAAPGASALHAAGAGALAIATSEDALAYGIGPRGRAAWRVRLPGPAAAPARPLGADVLLPCATALGGALLRIDPATGARGWEAPLDFVPSAAPAPFAGLLAATGTVGGDPVVTAMDPAAGRPIWTESSPVPGGPLVLSALPSALLVKTASGACAAISREGSLLWTQRRAAPHPPAANLPAVPARGLVLVPSEQVEVLDPATGAVLGAARAAAPAQLHVTAELSLVGCDTDGLVTALRLATHLGVV